MGCRIGLTTNIVPNSFRRESSSSVIMLLLSLNTLVASPSRMVFHGKLFTLGNASIDLNLQTQHQMKFSYLDLEPTMKAFWAKSVLRKIWYQLLSKRKGVLGKKLKRWSKEAVGNIFLRKKKKKGNIKQYRNP